jgi:hypothetical protein
MQVSRRLFAISAATATLAIAPKAAAAPGDALDGLWQGEMTQIPGPELSSPNGRWPAFRIVIAGNAVRVYLASEDGARFEEAKPGAFGITRLGNSAVISAIDASPVAPLGEGWVESWSIAVTLKADNVLSAIMARQVNNHQTRRGEQGAYFNMVLTGELHRTGEDHV